MEKMFQSPTRFLSYLNHYFWLAAQYYDEQNLREVILPRLVGIHSRVTSISSIAYGLISIGGYERAYLSELNTLIFDFVRDFEEVDKCSDCSQEDKFRKMDALVYSLSLRLVALEYDVKKDYVRKTLKEYLEAHRSVLGSEFNLLDLYLVLRRIVEEEFEFEIDEELPLKSEE